MNNFHIKGLVLKSIKSEDLLNQVTNLGGFEPQIYQHVTKNSYHSSQ